MTDVAMKYLEFAFSGPVSFVGAWIMLATVCHFGAYALANFRLIEVRR